MYFETHLKRAFSLTVLGFGCIVSVPAPAALTARLIDLIRSEPLKVKPVRKVTCVSTIRDFSGTRVKADSSVPVVSADDLLTLSIEIDKLAGKIFLAFPPKTAEMARQIYDEVFVTDDAERWLYSARFLRIAERPGRYAPDVRINSQLSRSIIYRKVALLQAALYLAFRRLGEQRTSLFDHWGQSEGLEADPTQWPGEYLSRLDRHSHMSSLLLGKLIIDQIPFIYLKMDLSYVRDWQLQSFFLHCTLSSISLQGFFLSPEYRRWTSNYDEADGKLMDLWIKDSLNRPTS